MRTLASSGVEQYAEPVTSPPGRTKQRNLHGRSLPFESTGLLAVCGDRAQATPADVATTRRLATARSVLAGVVVTNRPAPSPNSGSLPVRATGRLHGGVIIQSDRWRNIAVVMRLAVSLMVITLVRWLQRRLTKRRACAGPPIPAQAPVTVPRIPGSEEPSSPRSVMTSEEAQRCAPIRGLTWSSASTTRKPSLVRARAAELDPNAPMPHWGVAWALGPNINLDIDEARAKQARYRHREREAQGGGRDVERAYRCAGDSAIPD